MLTRRSFLCGIGCLFATPALSWSYGFTPKQIIERKEYANQTFDFRDKDHYTLYLCCTFKCCTFQWDNAGYLAFDDCLFVGSPIDLTIPNTTMIVHHVAFMGSVIVDGDNRSCLSALVS